MSLPFRLVRFLTLVFAVAGLIWGFLILPKSEALDDLWEMQGQLLRSVTFAPKVLANTLTDSESLNLSDCDSAAQTALLIIETLLSEADLRAGAVADFDRRSASIESRSERALSCAPRQSFIWLVKFSQAVLHGRFDERSFNLLTMSYETSPNEGWISIRRNIVVVPLLPVLPEKLQERALSDYQRLLRGEFYNEAARLYSESSPPIRLRLQAAIEKLELHRQKAFWDAVNKVSS